MNKGTVILKKRGGLSNIANIQGGFKEYYQKNIDRDSVGVYAGEYREPSLPKSKHYLAPIWEDIDDRWAWSGSQQDLARIVKKMGLRVERGREEGRTITIADVDLSNRDDIFFAHSFWYASKYMEGGRIMLNRDVEVDEFYVFCYGGSRWTHDKTNPRNDVFVKGAKYEMVNPRTVKAKQAKDVKAEIDATTLLGNMEFSKMKLIAEIMDLETVLEDPDTLIIGIKNQAVENSTSEARYGGKTPQQKFVELAKLSNEDLSIMARIMRAKKSRILVNKGSYYQFNTGGRTEGGEILSDRIDGISNDAQLINYFRKVKNQDYYLELENQLKKRDLL